MSELHNDAESTDAPETDVPETTGTDGETVGDLTVAELRDWLREWVSEATGMPADQISEDRPMEEFGLSSRDAVALGGDIEDKTGVVLTATVVYQHPTIASLAKRIIEGDPDEGRNELDAFWERERNPDDDIAIVGFSTRFPKAGETPESTWEALVAGKSGISDLPEDRWSEFKQDPKLAKIIADANVQGGYLDDVKAFDADFFQMSPREVEMVDPQQRLVLTHAWQALEDAGHAAASLAGSGVPVGPQVLKPGTLALDMMYGPAAQAFLDWARAHGATPRDGLGMLVEQAAEAFTLWRGVQPDTQPVLAHMRALVDAAQPH